MDPSSIYFKQITCPYCGTVISALRIKSRNYRIIKRDYDFGATYENNISPYIYEIVVCHGCGFAWNIDNEELLMPAHRQRLKPFLQRQKEDYNSEPRTVELGIFTYKLAIAQDVIRMVKSSALGKKYLHLAWIYRGLGNREEELRYLKAARDDYRESVSTEDLWHEQNGSEILATYMTAVLSHYIGDADTCRRWLSRVIFNHPEADQRPQVVKMARDLWSDIRDVDWRSSLGEIENLAKEQEEETKE
ncbi:MAG: DUF2225 domain-containing protein [Symbiobacteriaceae bacterium]|nr:DUF2225 domain-containing protein [Symbiobacteriaceae bacterium]